MRQTVKKVDDELQIVYSEVYAPNLPDSQGDFMTKVGVRKMAHNFMAQQNLQAVDTMHDNEENGSIVVESFIARDDDPIFLPGAWVVGIHIPDPEIWQEVKKGNLNGFSMEAMVAVEEVILDVDFPPEVTTQTIEDESGHQHTLTVKFDADGQFLGGETNTVDGHKHTIKRMTHVEEAEGHKHRMFLLEGLEIVTDEA